MRNFILQNFPFLEDDFDALTDYQLFCKMLSYVKKFANDNKEFSDRLTALENYVYNLDLQDEVDKKIQELYDNGSLAEIITTYLEIQGVIAFDTVADLKDAENLINGSLVRTFGYHSVNDGGGCFYKMVNSGTANEKELIACQNGLLASIVIDNNDIYPEKFGAYGDGIHDDTDIIQYLVNNYRTVKFYNKTYIVKGIKVLTDKTLIGQDTTFRGDMTTNGINLYTDDGSMVTRVKISGITLYLYDTGMLGIHVNHSQFNNIICGSCNVGANFTGETWTCKFYNCIFKDSEYDGFRCGLALTHPVLGTPINLAIATFDFYSCEFSNNNDYGINGWMLVFTITGGYAQNNRKGAVRIYSDETHTSQELNFIGFDIEEENIGYLFENPSGRCRTQFVNILGGQITINDPLNTINSALYFKGTECNLVYVHNINVQTRTDVFNYINNKYFIYVDVPMGAAKNLQGNFEVGNINNAQLNTNLDGILPNNIYLNDEVSLPLSMFDNNYYDGTNLTIPAGKSIEINIPEIKYVSNLKITTTSSALLLAEFYGIRVANIIKAGSSTSASVDNLTTLSFNSNCSKIKLINRLNTDTVITDIKFTGYVSK